MSVAQQNRLQLLVHASKPPWVCWTQGGEIDSPILGLARDAQLTLRLPCPGHCGGFEQAADSPSGRGSLKMPERGRSRGDIYSIPEKQAGEFMLNN